MLRFGVSLGTRGKSVLDRENSQYKGPEVRREPGEGRAQGWR